MIKLQLLLYCYCCWCLAQTTMKKHTLWGDPIIKKEKMPITGLLRSFTLGELAESFWRTPSKHRSTFREQANGRSSGLPLCSENCVAASVIQQLVVVLNKATARFHCIYTLRYVLMIGVKSSSLDCCILSVQC